VASRPRRIRPGGQEVALRALEFSARWYCRHPGNVVHAYYHGGCTFGEVVLKSRSCRYPELLSYTNELDRALDLHIPFCW